MENLTQLLKAASEAGTQQANQSVWSAINHAIESDLGSYVSGLCKIILDPAADLTIKQIACTQLKQVFTGQTIRANLIATQRWFSLNESIREGVKQTLFNALADPVIANTAAVALAPISIIELENNSWTNLISDLSTIAVGAETPMSARASVLCAIGYIVDQASIRSPNVMKPELVNSILSAVITNIQPHISDPQVRENAAVALTHVIQFAGPNFDAPSECEFIMMAVLNAAVSPEPQIKRPALQALERIARKHYRHLGDTSASNGESYIQNIFTVTMNQITRVVEAAELSSDHCSYGGDEDQCAIECCNFWRSLAMTEATLRDDSPDLYKQYTLDALEWLVKNLTRAMCTQVENQEPDFINISSAAGVCLRACAVVAGDKIIPSIMAFVDANVQSADWRHAEAATLAFGAIVEHCTDGLDPYIVNAVNFFTENTMKHPVLIVRETGAWTMSELCKYKAEIICRNCLGKVMESFGKCFGDEPRVLLNVCTALGNLFANSTSVVNPSTGEHILADNITEVMNALLKTLDRSDIDEPNFRNAVHNCINQLVTVSPVRMFSSILSLLNEFRRRLDILLTQVKSGNVTLRASEESAGLLCGSINGIVTRMALDDSGSGRTMLVPVIPNIMEVLLDRIILGGITGVVLEESLLALSPIIAITDKNFVPYAQKLFPVIIEFLGRPESSDLFSVVLGLTGDLVAAVGTNFSGQVDAILDGVKKVVGAPELTTPTIPILINMLSDFTNVGERFCQMYFADVLQILSFYTTVKVKDQDNVDEIENVQNIRASILSAISVILDCLLEYHFEETLSSSLSGFIGFMKMCYEDEHCLRSVLFSIVGLIGDLAYAFPQNAKPLFDVDWVKFLLRDAYSTAVTERDTGNLNVTVKVLQDNGIQIS